MNFEEFFEQYDAESPPKFHQGELYRDQTATSAEIINTLHRSEYVSAQLRDDLNELDLRFLPNSPGIWIHGDLCLQSYEEILWFADELKHMAKQLKDKLEA